MVKLRIFCVSLAFIVWAGFAWAADGDVLFKNANSLDQIGDGKDKGIVLVGEDIKPITIVGPINGTCSGQVVVFSTAKLPVISAKIGTLATAAGDKLPD